MTDELQKLIQDGNFTEEEIEAAVNALKSMRPKETAGDQPDPASPMRHALVKAGLYKVRPIKISVNNARLLTKAEFRRYRNVIPYQHMHEFWFLNTPSNSPNYVTGVVNGGKTGIAPLGWGYTHAVHPVIEFDPQSSILVGDKVSLGDLLFTVIDSGRAISDHPAFYSDWGYEQDYETSEVKKNLDEWFEKVVS